MRIEKALWVGCIAAQMVWSSMAWAQTGKRKMEPKEQVVLFEWNSSEIARDARQDLDGLVQWLKQNRKRTVILRDEPLAAPGEGVGMRSGRAVAVKEYLTANGIDELRISVIAEGEPVATTAGRARMMRVLVLADRPGSRQAQEAREMAERNQQELQNVGRQLGDTRAEVEKVRGELREVRAEAAKPSPPPPVVEPDEREKELAARREHEKQAPPILTPGGLGVSIGGGVTDLMDEDTRAFSDVGGTWEARLMYGTRYLIGAEAAYVGSAARLHADGLADKAALLGSSFEGAMVVNAPVNLVRPYVFGGIGVSQYRVVNTEFNDSNLKDDEVAYYVPVGLGVGMQWRGLLFDVRGTLRPAFSDELRRDTSEGPRAGLSSWAATGRVGWEF